MPSKYTRREGKLFYNSGSLVDEVHSENDKYYAVIAKCGHCGDGFYIPIIFTEKCKDIQTAIELVKSAPKVKRDRKDFVLEAFEITKFQKFFIEAINDHDPYIKGYLLKKTLELEERRVVDEEVLKNPDEDRFRYVKFKTADSYDKKFVIERCFAPYQLGDDLIFPKRVDTQQLLHDFFQRATIRYGIAKDNPFFLGLYYQLYGEDNDLRIKKEKNRFYFNKYGEITSCEIPDSLLEKIEETLKQMEERVEPLEEFSSERPIKLKSQFEKFNDRMKKHQDKINLGQEPERE